MKTNNEIAFEILAKRNETFKTKVTENVKQGEGLKEYQAKFLMPEPKRTDRQDAKPLSAYQIYMESLKNAK